MPRAAIAGPGELFGGLGTPRGNQWRSVMRPTRYRKHPIVARGPGVTAGRAVVDGRKMARLRPLRRAFATAQGAGRHIGVGSSLLDDGVHFVHAHPWFVDGRSNDEVDNSVTTRALFGGRRVALFGLPAPFTGTCSEAHVPGYMALADDFKARGIDELVCFSLACPYAMDGWRTALGADGEDTAITFLADPTGTVTASWGLGIDYSSTSLGQRSRRFSFVADDGNITAFNMVKNAAGDAEVLLGQVAA